jgi:tripartite-type tricarboxylate transporter receptor subunit TctC
LVNKKLPYDSLRDFKPVALMGMSEHVLVTHPSSGIKRLSDVAALAKSKAGLTYASFGQGTSAHLAGEMLKTQLDIDQTSFNITHVPYKGQAPALADLLGGQVSMMFGNWPEFRAHIQAGKLIALGMATSQRSAYAPLIPTLKEQGVNVESNSWNGLLAAADTPTPIIALMNAVVNKALNMPTVVDAFQKGGIASLSGTNAQFGDFIQSEIKRYSEVIRKANISAEG